MNLVDAMRTFFESLFVWWKGYTIGTYIFTLRNGIYVGSDKRGNRYFRSKNDERRWVLYEKNCDASAISPSWHGWIHGTVEKLPTLDTTALVKEPDDVHYKNMTGTANAYHPRKYSSSKEIDYIPWEPKN